jgi:uncharacterized glyoxalase superfamily protein PhnB
MSEETQGYVIVPSTLNPKFGIVVPSVPYVKPKSSYVEPYQRRKDHIANHRKGFENTLTQESSFRYRMKATHLFHFLQCEIPMEIREEAHMGKSLVCDFPTIDGEVMNGFVNDDEFLYETLLIHFQMNIMYHLLVFCEQHQVENLILHVEKEYAQELAIYEDIVTFGDASNQNGKKTMMMINVEASICKKWKKTMHIGIRELQKKMWAEKNNNTVVYEYIKLNPFHHLFC